MWPMWGIKWSHDRWRHMTQKVKVVTQISLDANISKTLRDIETWYQWTTNRKGPMRNRLVTLSMTSPDLER